MPSVLQSSTDSATLPAPKSFVPAENSAQEVATPNTQHPTPNTSRSRLRRFVEHLYRNPEAEAEAVDERRARLLEELTQAVAEAPEDMPIRDVIAKLNRHDDD